MLWAPQLKLLISLVFLSIVWLDRGSKWENSYIFMFPVWTEPLMSNDTLRPVFPLSSCTPPWPYIFTRGRKPLPLASLVCVAAAVLCVGKSWMKRGCPLRTHTSASTHATWGGNQFVWRRLLFSTLILVLISSSSALTQGVKAAITAIIMFISVAWNFSSISGVCKDVGAGSQGHRSLVLPLMEPIWFRDCIKMICRGRDPEP